MRRTGRAALSAGRLALAQRWGGDVSSSVEPLVAQLDELKGMAMKVGQILSYMDVPLAPEAQRVLAKLQTGHRGLPFTAIEPQIVRALGAPIRDLFESLDPEPIAAASIGQVHRGRDRGRDVAVKVLYPGIRDTIRTDIRSLENVASLASVASSVDGRALVRELAERFEEECDYSHEAIEQTRFRLAFADVSEIVIPEVIADRSAQEVLTSAWIDGTPLDQPPPSQRGSLARALVLFSFQSLLVFGAIQADPHPGNFNVDERGRLVCFDFGSIRTFPTRTVELMREHLQSAIEGDRRRFRASTIELGFVGHPKRFDFDAFWAAYQDAYAPFLVPAIHLDSAALKRMYAHFGPRSPNARWMAMPPEQLWVQRLVFGLWSVIARLDVEVELADIMPLLLAQPIRERPPVSPAPPTHHAARI